MQLPNKEKAYVDRKKLTGYLLAESHPVGRTKARVFRKMGFSREEPELLEEAILSIANFQDVVELTRSKFGTKYVVDGQLQGPTGNALHIRTVWIIEKGEEIPRFITAYPLLERGNKK